MSAITLFTATGRALLAAAVANGQAFASAKIAVGDGNGQVYVPNESQTTLVHEVWRGLASVARTDDLVVFRATIPANVGDFIVRELGLYLGPVDAEQLFIISQSPSREKIATPANGGGPMEVSVHFSANAAQVAVLPAGSSGTAMLQLQNAPHITVDGIITAPPAEPVDGMLYAIDTGASGIFTGQAGSLVERVAGAWVFRPMRNYSVIRDAGNGAWLERSGTDWVPFSFNDTSVAWTEVNNKPTEFPPAVHNHDDRYFTETEADGRFVRLNPPGGATQTISNSAFRLARSDSADLFILENLGANGAKFNWSVGGGGWENGKLLLRDQTGGADNVRMSVLPNGNVGIGTANPTEKVDISGNLKATCLKGEALDFLAAGVSTWTQYQNADTWILHNYTLAGTKISVNKEGDISIARAVNVSNWVGYNGMVLRSQGAGQPSQWSSLADLQPQMQYDHVIAQGVTWMITTTNTWVKLPLNTLVANNIPGASAAASVVTLPAGTYEVMGRVNQSVGAGTRWQGRVRNTTSGTTIAVTMLGGASGYEPITEHTAVGRFTLAAAANIELQCWAENATNGATQNLASGEAIIMNSLTITKIG